MSGCWRALCFLLGPRGPDNGERFSRSRRYRVDANADPIWESNLTEPLLDESAGLTNNGRPMTYVVEDSVEVPLSSVAAEQLYPAGRILHIIQRPTIRCVLLSLLHFILCELLDVLRKQQQQLKSHFRDTLSIFLCLRLSASCKRQFMVRVD